MSETTEPIKVQIIGDHPWSGYTGTLESVIRPLGFLPKMGKVVFDSHQITHGETGCFAESKNLRRIKPLPPVQP